jgi:hypothetical protein
MCYHCYHRSATQRKLSRTRFQIQPLSPGLRQYPDSARQLTITRLTFIINPKMNLTSRNVCAGWWRWHLDAPACAPAL